jgi:hypothetical protein
VATVGKIRNPAAAAASARPAQFTRPFK